MVKIVESFVTKNPCYTKEEKIKVKGLMLHSIGTPQPKATVIVNNWDSASAKDCVHAVIDANDGTVYQILPWNYKAWHCASGKNGSANNTHIGVEVAEPAEIRYSEGSTFTFPEEKRDRVLKAVKTGYEAAVELFAYLCKAYDLDPLANDVIISHAEGYTRGIASNHGDIDHLWAQTGSGYTMDGFRADVSKALAELNVAPGELNESSNIQPKKLYRIRKSATNNKSQLGAFEDLENAKRVVDENPGYYVFDWDFNVVYPELPVRTVPFLIKVTSSDTPLTIYKEPNKKASKWSSKVTAGVFTIVEIQNGRDSINGWGLLRAYSSNRSGWVNLDDVKTFL